MGEAKRKKSFNQNNEKPKLNLNPDLTKPRKWLIHDYNEKTKTYILTSEDDNCLIWSCLSCKTKLEENQYYLGYKNLQTKELILIHPDTLTPHP